MGKLKKRVMPEDVIINCSKDSKKPVPPEGHKWKEVRHDNTVSCSSCGCLCVACSDHSSNGFFRLEISGNLVGELD